MNLKCKIFRVYVRLPEQFLQGELDHLEVVGEGDEAGGGFAIDAAVPSRQRPAMGIG